MIKRNKWKLLASSIIILLPMLVGAILWNALPDRMAAHWGLNGAADGWSGRAFSVFGMPLIFLAGHWICIAVTALDPKNRHQTRKAMGLIFWIFPFASLLAGAMVYANAFGMNPGGSAVFTVVLGLMFVVIGNLLPKCKRNYTMGIKVKWALEDDENWNATHRFGGKVWVGGGLLIALCAFLPGAAVHYVSFALIIVLAIIPAVYSYVYYRKHGRSGPAIEGDRPYAHRKIRPALLCVILAGVAVLCLTGSIRIECGDESFTIDATYWGDLTVDYARVERIEYREGSMPGSRTGGFGSPRLQMGNYNNDEFGFYTRYTYTMCHEYVVLTVDGRALVINGSDPAQTRAIYDELAARIGTD